MKSRASALDKYWASSYSFRTDNKKNYTEHKKSNTSDLLWIIFIIIIIIIDFFLQNSYLTDDNPYSFSSSSYPVLSKKKY